MWQPNVLLVGLQKDNKVKKNLMAYQRLKTENQDVKKKIPANLRHIPPPNIAEVKSSF